MYKLIFPQPLFCPR